LGLRILGAEGKHRGVEFFRILNHSDNIEARIEHPKSSVEKPLTRHLKSFKNFLIDIKKISGYKTNMPFRVGRATAWRGDLWGRSSQSDLWGRSSQSEAPSPKL
jgi:hypothetical protein